jgi:hypothetical protein
MLILVIANLVRQLNIPLKYLSEEVVDEQDETLGERWLWEFVQQQMRANEER